MHTGDPVAGIEVRGGGASVAVKLRSGAVIEAAKALVGVGRTLETRGLDCEKAGIAIDRPRRDRRRRRPADVAAAHPRRRRRHRQDAAGARGVVHGRVRRAARGRSAVPAGSVPLDPLGDVHDAGGRGCRACPSRRPSSPGWSCFAASVPLMDNVKARIDRTTEGFVKIVAERGTGTDRRRNDRRASCLGHDPRHRAGGSQGDDGRPR